MRVDYKHFPEYHIKHTDDFRSHVLIFSKNLRGTNLQEQSLKSKLKPPTLSEPSTLLNKTKKNSSKFLKYEIIRNWIFSFHKPKLYIFSFNDIKI